MPSTEKQLERRKHERFQVPTGAVVTFGPPYLRLGRVINIGIGGLGYSYTADLELPNPSSELDIFSAAWDFYLYNIPFVTIWDFETDGMRYSSTKMRRSGLQFRQLTSAQMSRLEYFIEKHVTGSI
ncbi:MAG: PilZ domain-containing protein [Desulfobacterales bacterium]|nr:MAG: PilZ domain-containing protein [Desulfobacterales bacterium]